MPGIIMPESSDDPEDYDSLDRFFEAARAVHEHQNRQIRRGCLAILLVLSLVAALIYWLLF